MITLFFCIPKLTQSAPLLSCPDITVATPEGQARLETINDLYFEYYRRSARCDELKTHFDNKTTSKKLRAHFRKTIGGWLTNLASSHLNGRVVTAGKTAYLVRGSSVFTIPDWLTGLSWGVTLDSRFVMPKDMEAKWRESIGTVTTLSFSAGPYADRIRSVWWNGGTPSATLPAKVRAELTRLRTRNIFEDTAYRPERANDPFVKYFDWSWMKANPVNFTIAFFGDQGLNNNAIAVLRLLKNERADMVLHLGDFEYTDSPAVWGTMVESVLPPPFPYFGLVGNHDVAAWDGYASVLTAWRNGFSGESCRGEIGVKEVCTFRGMRFIISGVGTYGSDHETFLRTELAKPFDGWTVCAWHKNQRLMQVGGKADEVGWEPYERCREAGAIVATAHEHSYSRTHLMSSFQNQTIASTESAFRIEPGKSFAFVSGLGGSSIRNQDLELYVNPWWASLYTSDQNANFGALFCTFNYQGDARRAHCYFKDIDGRVPDQFDVFR